MIIHLFNDQCFLSKYLIYFYLLHKGTFMDFETQVHVEIRYSSVTHTRFDYESRNSTSNIIYNMDIEYKSWGINGFQVSVPDQKIIIDLDFIEKDNEDTKTRTIEISLSDIHVNLDLSDNSFQLNKAICPQTLEIEITEIELKDEYTFIAKGTGSLSF